jgi:hypothetical protein
MRTMEPESADRPARDWGVYLYCFARGSVADRIASPGVDDSESAPAPQPGPEPQRRAVTALTVRDLAAIVSPVRLEVFRGPTGDGHLRDRAWLVPRARQHEQVVEEVMRLSPVLPARFGSVLSSAAVLEDVTARHAAQIRLFLERVAGREEWSAKAFLDVTRAEAGLLAAQDTSSRSPGRRYIEAQQRRAQARRELKNYSRRVAEEIEQALTPITAEMCRLRVPSLETPDQAGRMILHCALLLPKTRVLQWRAKIRALEARYVTQGVSLAVSGPWPPYSFCPTVLDGEPSE